MVSLTVNDDIKKLFSSKEKWFVTSKRLRRKYEALGLSLLFLVSEEWMLPEDVLTAGLQPSESPRRMLTPFTTFNPKLKGT